MKDNILSQMQYNQIKKVNTETDIIIEHSINCIYEMFKNINKYISKPFKLKRILYNLYFFNERINCIMKELLEKAEIKQVKNTNGVLENINYYYEKDYELIMDIVYNKEDNLILKTFEMSKCLTLQGNNLVKKIRKNAVEELKKQKESLKQIHVSENINYRFLRFENIKKYL